MGYTRAEVAERLGLARETVSRWYSAYAEGGAEALPGERTGRPVGSGRTLNDGQALWLRSILVNKQPEEVGIPSRAIALCWVIWPSQARGILITLGSGIRRPGDGPWPIHSTEVLACAPPPLPRS